MHPSQVEQCDANGKRWETAVRVPDDTRRPRDPDTAVPNEQAQKQGYRMYESQ